MTPANDTAFSVKLPAAPTDVMSRPPTAGPMARARFTLAPLSSAACGTSSRGTSSGWIAENVGAASAFPAPMIAVRTSSSAGVVASAKVSIARAPAPPSMIAWLTIRSRRRSTMSPRLPNGSTSRNTGSVVAVCSRDTSNAPPPRSPISHWAPTVCAQVPTFPANCAIQIARKTRWWNGAHTELSLTRSTLGGLAPLPIAEARVFQHTPQIDHGPDVDVLAVRSREHLGLRAERHPELAVVFVLDGADRLEQRNNLAPLDVPARRVREDLLDGVAVATA